MSSLKNIFILKDSDSSIMSNNTPTNDPDFSFDIKNNEKWEFEIFGTYNDTTGGSAQFRYQIVDPSSPNFVSIFDMTQFIGGGSSAFMPIGFSNPQDLTGSTNLLYIKGTIFNGSNSGTIQLQWSQANSNVNPLILKAGSYLSAKMI